MSSIHTEVINFDGSTHSGEKPKDFVVLERIKDQIEIHKLTLNDVFGERYRIPEYQRGYQWGEQQWKDLWSELSAFINAGKNIEDTTNRAPDVFFGSMFLSQRKAEEVLDTGEEGSVYDIIDGQQRITTLSILFKLVGNILQENLKDCSSGFIGRYAQHVGLTNNLIYRGDDPESGPALTLEPRNRDFFRALLRDDDALIMYLLFQDQVPTQSRGDGQMKIKEYLDKFGIPEKRYLELLFQDDYFLGGENEYLESIISKDKFYNLDAERPNTKLYTKDQSIIRQYSSPSELSEDEKKELLENRVEFDTSNQNLFNCYHYFKEKLHAEISIQDAEESYRFATNIKNYILYSFRIGQFELKDDRPELLMKIFEVLNDRGLELKKTDLIRTKLVGNLNKLGDVGEKEEYIKRWNDIISRFNSDHGEIITFLETYFVVSSNQPNITARGDIGTHLLEAFSSSEESDDSYKMSPELSDEGDAKEMIDKLDRYSKYYTDIISPVRSGGFEFNSESDEAKHCNRSLKRLNQTGTDIWESLVLAFYHDIKQNPEHDVKELENLLDTIESFVIRYYVTGDINAKDAIYESGIKEYHRSGPSESVVSAMVRVAKDEDSDIFGENLIKKLATQQWAPKRVRPVLQMITSNRLEDGSEGTLLEKQLNQDSDEVELEHVFPQSPVGSDGGKYDWVENFFELMDINPPNNVDDTTTFEESLRSLIDIDEQERIESVSTDYANLIGNHLLLISETNNAISNSPFSIKLVGYSQTDHFGELFSNEYLHQKYISGSSLEGTDIPTTGKSEHKYKEFINNNLAEPEAFIENMDNAWTDDTVWKNTTRLVQELYSQIQFDIPDESVTDIGHDEIDKFVREERETMEQIIRANNRRFL
jgi:uncharacterized protein with ParB-like and HNH nuclease domain